MQNIHRILLALCVTYTLITSSCSIQKRHYRSGFYVADFFQKNGRQEVHKSDSAAQSVAAEQLPDSVVTESSLTGSTLCADTAQQPTTARSDLKDTVSKRSVPLLLPRLVNVQNRNSDEPVVQYDRPNKTIRNIMMIAAACVILYILFRIFGPPVIIAPLIFLLPGFGALLFGIGLYLRHWVKKIRKEGVKSESLHLSAHFKKFVIPLTLWFLGAAIYCSAWLIGMFWWFWSSGLGTFVLLNVGWMLMLYVPLVLVLLGLVYWFYWRKKPLTK